MARRAELEALWNAYLAAYRTGDARACAALFTEDALLTSPYGPAARGRTAIEAIHADWVSEDGAEAKTLRLLEDGGSSEEAWCLAAYDEGEGETGGVSLSILERQPDGSWLIRICSLNETA